MAATLRIPTIFTAVDKISSVVSKMGANVTGFANKMESGIARGNRLFNKLTPSIGQAGKELLAFASTAAIAGSIVAGVHFSIDSLMKYEDAVASFRTIVSDLPDADFAIYQKSMDKVAKDTRTSAVDVANSFEMIAGLNEKFAKTSDGLSAVSKASITLSKASRDDLGTSAQNLVGIMNQFNLAAGEADRVINVLAAGQAVGASSITQSAEAYKNFGTVAKSSNITLEESTALIQVLASKSLYGAEAGTKLRGATLLLQKAGMGYKSGLFSINDALEEANSKMSKLKTAKEKDAFATKLFGAENITAGKILLSNMPLYEKFKTGVTGTSEAEKAAAINTSTLSSKIDQAKAAFVNFITSSDETKTSLNLVKNVIGFLGENMSQIISIGLSVLGFFAAWKALLLLSEAAMFVYNVALGINNALQKKSLFFVEGNTVAKAADTAMTYAMAAATWVATAAASAFAFAVGLGLLPILAIIAAVAAIIAIFIYWDEIVAWFCDTFSMELAILGAAFDYVMAGIKNAWNVAIGFILVIWEVLKNAWDTVVDSFDFTGIKEGFISIGQTILEFVLAPVKMVLTLLSKMPGAMGKLAGQGLNVLNSITGEDDKNPDGSPKPVLQSPTIASNKNTMETIQRNNVGIDIRDSGNNISNVSQSGDFEIPIKVSSTQGSR